MDLLEFLIQSVVPEVLLPLASSSLALALVRALTPMEARGHSGGK